MLSGHIPPAGKCKSADDQERNDTGDFCSTAHFVHLNCKTIVGLRRGVKAKVWARGRESMNLVRPKIVLRGVMKFLLWCILLVLCWPLALLALVVYPLVWIVLIPFRLVGIAVDGVLGLLRSLVMLPSRLVSGPRGL